MQDWTRNAIVVLGLLTLVVPPPLLGASPGNALDACGVENPMVYIRSSLQRVEEGEELKTVLDTLACIAKSTARSSVAGASVKALFHLAGHDSLIREYLLEIVDAGDNLGRSKAGPLLVLVANEDVRRALLEQAQARWKTSTDFSGQSLALVELGDLAYLSWLEEHVLTAQSDEWARHHHGIEAAKIRIQHDSQAILAQIGSATPKFNRSWLVRHALRGNVPRERLRAALLDFIRPSGATAKRRAIDSRLLALCMDNGVLSDSELTELESRTGKAISHPANVVWWAVSADIRWRAFYSYDRKEGPSQRDGKP